MDESPATAVRRKKDSSIGRAVDLVKDGQGRRGVLGRQHRRGGGRHHPEAADPGRGRPSGHCHRVPHPRANRLCCWMPGPTPTARPACWSSSRSWAAVYSREILHVDNPAVGLLSIGEEDAKGNEVDQGGLPAAGAGPASISGATWRAGDLFDGQGRRGGLRRVCRQCRAQDQRERGPRPSGTGCKEELDQQAAVRARGPALRRGAFRQIKREVGPGRLRRGPAARGQRGLHHRPRVLHRDRGAQRHPGGRRERGPPHQSADHRTDPELPRSRPMHDAASNRRSPGLRDRACIVGHRVLRARSGC